MAIRKRAGRAKPWQVYWNNPCTGKRESVSFETREEAEKEDSLIKHRLKFERESFGREEKKEAGDSTLEEAFLAYLREKGFSGQSLSWQLSSMRIPLRELGQTPLSAISFEHLTGIMEIFRKSGIKTCTMRGRMGVLRTLLRWSAWHGLCEMPRFPRLPAADYERFIPPSPKELAAIMEAAPPHVRRVVILGAQLGCRVGPCELFGLTWEDVDLMQGILRIHGAKKNMNAPWREVPIRESLMSLMAKWAHEDRAAGLIWLIHFEGKPVKSIRTAWRGTLRRAGIERRIRPYDLRHAFATELIAAGADIGTVAKLMGHSSPAMILRHYQYVMDGQKRAAVEKLPDFQYVPKPCAQIEKD